MSAYTCNLVTFGLSSLDVPFNSMAMVDGVAVGLDEDGAFVLDAESDEGADFEVRVQTGWSDGAGSFPDQVDASYLKRVLALYVDGMKPEALDLRVDAGYFSGLVPLRNFHRPVVEGVPVSARAVPPKGLYAVFWRFALSGLNGGIRICRVRGVFELLKRRV